MSSGRHPFLSAPLIIIATDRRGELIDDGRDQLAGATGR
jgi:hypothetical protein